VREPDICRRQRREKRRHDSRRLPEDVAAAQTDRLISQSGIEIYSQFFYRNNFFVVVLYFRTRVARLGEFSPMYWPIVYFGQYLKNDINIPKIGATFFHEKLIFDKKGDLLTKLIKFVLFQISFGHYFPNATIRPIGSH
jgi:hypothetical protein